ncbi:MAG: NAD(P)/FAD-dependent oxidoreductase [Deltaproteobacteria bacterium]|nr:NAD(P)/FAD-dependent oxidoreductase [Deltaproteobacteria bacterium]
MAGKVVVIGSGIGGSGAGALLASAGYDVTLFESQPFSGGRCASLEKGGFRYDIGVHMFSRADRGPIGEINRCLGGDLTWIHRNPPCRVMGRVEFDFPLDIRPLGTQINIARSLGVKPKHYLGAFRLFRSLLRGTGVQRNDEIMLRDYIHRYTDDDVIHLFMNCISQLYFALSYNESSAGEFIWSFSRMFNDAAFGYPTGAGGEITDSFLRSGGRWGMKVRFEEQVRRIIVKRGLVWAVETDRGTCRADIVVSNAGLLNTIRLAGEEHFPDDYVAKAEGYVDSNAYVTIKYALERPVISYPVVFYMPSGDPRGVFDYIRQGRVPEDPYIFMPVPSNHDPRLAPPGMQLVIAGTAVPSDASDELCRAVQDSIHRKVCELFPDLEGAIIWQLRSTGRDVAELTGHRRGECIGLGQTPSQVGELRPSMKTPVQGLWLVGADAGARGIGTEIAAGSALSLSAVLNPR